MPRSHPTMRAMILLVGLATATALLPAIAASATIRPAGNLEAARQTAEGHISISGWAYDPGKSASNVRVDVYVDGKFAGRPLAYHPRPDVNRARRVSGIHGFAWTFAWQRHAHLLTVYARPLLRGEVRALIGARYLNGYRPPASLSPGTRIVTEARKYVGRTPYVYGGTSPVAGFDCSGYTQYVYRVTHVSNLPRTAEQQRRAVRIISRSQARAGDLVFYLSGGSAYHEAIYAGNGMQYAAATPQDGIRYQGVWSAQVQYGTTWH